MARNVSLRSDRANVGTSIPDWRIVRRRLLGAPYAPAYTRQRRSLMCGIAGLFSKTEKMEAALGGHLAEMLLQLGDRGPDSAGVAFYRNPVEPGSCKVTLHSTDSRVDWPGVSAALGDAFGAGEPEVRASHAVIAVDADAPTVVAWLRERYPELRHH